MNRHSLVCAMIAVVSCAGTARAGQQNIAAPGSWTGVIISSACTADEAFAESEKCATPDAHANLVFYDDNTRQIYSVDPQAQADGHLGESVTVRGKLDGGAIRGASVTPLTSFGLNTGHKAPSFALTDQFGHEQTLATLIGTKGTVLLFFRSADWCPYCKGQLIQLQSARKRFEEQGLKLAGISYDSVEILKSFADRHKIDFPLLSDKDSTAIRAYDVLNAEATGQNKGMARPGYFFLDSQGVIREKFFEARYRDRLTGNSVLTKIFPALGDQVTNTIEQPHFTMHIAQSDSAAMPGNVVTLTAEVVLPPDVHVYAPGAKDYKPVNLTLASSPDLEFRSLDYPQAKKLYLPAVKETAPVYEGTFRIRQQVKVNSTSAYSSALGPDGKTVTIQGKIDYQACDRKICFFPASVPVSWQLQIVPLDRQRAPDDIRHK